MAGAIVGERPRRVLLTGATGTVGPRVVARLIEKGWSVRVLALEEQPAISFGAGVEVVAGDITDPSAVCRAAERTAAIVHMAALLHVQNPGAGMAAEYERINVQGTANLLAAAAAAEVERVVFFSTIAVYGRSSGRVISEDAVPLPDTPYARSKLAAEELVLHSRRPDGRPLGTVLRLAAVYGSRMKGNYRTLVRALARRRFLPVGDGCSRRTLVYDHDVASAVLLALACPDAAGAVFNVTDSGPHRMSEIIGAICLALGRRPPRFHVPLRAAQLAARLADSVLRLAGHRSPFAVAAVSKYVDDLPVSGERMRRELGFRPAYDLETGWREVIREMREAGEL